MIMNTETKEILKASDAAMARLDAAMDKLRGFVAAKVYLEASLTAYKDADDEHAAEAKAAGLTAVHEYCDLKEKL